MPEKRAILMRVLADFQAWYESHDLRVGCYYFHADEIALLETNRNEFDVQASRVLRDAGIRGALWGALVREDPCVLPGFVIIVQDDIEVASVGPAASMSLGLEYHGIEIPPGNRLQA